MAKKKSKAAAKKKAKAAPGKKAKKAVKKKAMPVAKKIKSVAKSKAKPAASKKAKAPAKSKAKKVSKKETLPDTEELTRGEDLHFIPKPGEEHPVGADEAHQIENRFHNREEVAFRQENQKIKDSLAKRNTKGYRNRGLR